MRRNNKNTNDSGSRGTWGYIARAIKPYAPQIAASILLSAVTVGLTLYIPIKIGEVIDKIVGKNNVDFEAIMPMLGTILVMAAAAGVAQWIAGALNNRVTYGVVRDIRCRAHSHIQTLPLSYLDRRPAGELVSRLITDADKFSDGLLLGFTQLFTGVLTIIGTLVFMLTINVWITLVVALLTPMSIFVARFIAGRTYSLFRRQSETRGELTSYIDEMIGGMKTVRAFGREGKTNEKFDAINDRLKTVSVSAIFFSSLTNPTTRFLNAVVYAAVALAGALTSIGGGISVGMLTSFLAYANQYSKPFNEISGVVTELGASLASASRLFELMEVAPESPDREDAAELTADGMSGININGKADRNDTTGKDVITGKAANLSKSDAAVTPNTTVKAATAVNADTTGEADINDTAEKSNTSANLPKKASGEVALEHIAFSYTPERPLIRDVNVHVAAGQHVAIVGPTGCGKTTLINLLLRFYDVTGGAIKVDGTDIRDVTRASLRRSYGMVLQDTWIKTATVRENIKLGHPSATDEEMIAAARAAHADGFIRRLPRGYDTLLGEGGESLSQGQRQLLSISRIMLSLPPILILDEATSSIDTRTEARINRAFTEMMAGRTAFVVAHRLGTVKNSDLILVMKDGDIIEQGTHDSLLAKGGFYKHLWESQFEVV